MSKIYRIVFDLGLIGVVGWLVYGNIFANQFVWEDINYLLLWKEIEGWESVGKVMVGFTPSGVAIEYQPLSNFLMLLVKNLSGTLLVYHLFSLAVLIGSAWLVYLIAKKIGLGRWPSVVSGLSFALHPIHVEAITYMRASFVSSGSMIGLMAIYFYLWADDEKVKEVQFKFLSLVLYLAALFFDVRLIAVLLVIFGHEWINRKNSVREISEKLVGFLFVTIGYFAIRLVMIGSIFDGGWSSGVLAWDLVMRLVVWTRYVWLVLAPIKLSVDHQIISNLMSIGSKQVQFSVGLIREFWVLLTIGAIGTAFLAGRKIFKRKSPFAFGVFWLVVGMLPTIIVIPENLMFAERYVFFASVGLALWIGILAQKIDFREREDRLILIVVYLSLLGMLSWNRNMTWSDELTLWNVTTLDQPKSVYSWKRLGLIQENAGLSEDAIVSYQNVKELGADDEKFGEKIDILCNQIDSDFYLCKK